jgi:Xaa-Pro dipeptidase
MRRCTRIENIQRELQRSAPDRAGIVLTHPVDVYYATRTMQSGMLFVPIDGEPLFFVRRSVERAMAESVVAVRPLVRLRDVVADVYARWGMSTQTWAVPFDTLRTDQFMRMRDACAAWTWVDGAHVIRTVRMIKDEDEIASMRRAAVLVDHALRASWQHAHSEMSEVALLALIEAELRAGHDVRLIRARAPHMDIQTGIVSSGARAAMPSAFDGPLAGLGLHRAFPKGASAHALGRGVPIVIDIGANVDGYLTDQTRIGVVGEWTDARWVRTYDTAVHILRSLEQLLKPGTPCHMLYTHAQQLAEQAGLGRHFMGDGQAVSFVGHGIGLEIDEWPVLAPRCETLLAPGMVLAIEPKFVFAGSGAIGIENTYVITEHGFAQLTVSSEHIFTRE